MGKDTLWAMINLIESDDIARALGEWKPLYVNPTTLALACQSLIARSTFPPKPAELASACRKARNRVNGAVRFCEQLCEHAQRCDAVLLEFAPDEWRQAYAEPEYRKLVLPRMLDKHAIYGPRIDQARLAYGHDDVPFSDVPPSDDPNDEENFWVESEHNRNFRLALTRARQSFPELPPHPSWRVVLPAVEDQTNKPMAKIAACAASVPKRTKRSKTIKQGQPNVTENDDGIVH